MFIKKKQKLTGLRCEASRADKDCNGQSECGRIEVCRKRNGCAGLFMCGRKECTARANNMENTVIGMLPYPNFIHTHAQAHKIKFHNSNRKYSFDSSFIFIHNS